MPPPQAEPAPAAASHPSSAFPAHRIIQASGGCTLEVPHSSRCSASSGAVWDYSQLPGGSHTPEGAFPDEVFSLIHRGRWTPGGGPGPRINPVSAFFSPTLKPGPMAVLLSPPCRTPALIPTLPVTLAIMTPLPAGSCLRKGRLCVSPAHGRCQAPGTPGQESAPNPRQPFSPSSTSQTPHLLVGVGLEWDRWQAAGGEPLPHTLDQARSLLPKFSSSFPYPWASPSLGISPAFAAALLPWACPQWEPLAQCGDGSTTTPAPTVAPMTTVLR